MIRMVVGLTLFTAMAIGVLVLGACMGTNPKYEVYSELSLEDRLLVESYADCVTSRIPRSREIRAVTSGHSVARALHEGALTREDMAVVYRNLNCGEISPEE